MSKKLLAMLLVLVMSLPLFAAAIAEEDALLRFVFWAEYGYEHPEMGAAHGESNLWQQSIPVWDQEYEDPKSTYIMPILTGSFDDSVHHPGDQVWIDLTVENVNPTDTIQGIKFEWYGVDEKGDSSIEPAFTVDMPDVILMPGESYTLKHRFFFGVDQEEALKGHYILDFHAWCHSVTYEWNANCAWSGLIRMEPDEVRAILSHGYGICSDVEPITNMEKSLFTVDELTGIIGACARMRPHGLADLEVSSFMKKFKDKKFAAKCDRELIQRGCEMLGMEVRDVAAICIEGMRPFAAELGLEGTEG